MNPILASLADLYPAGTPAECLVYAPTMACAKVELQTGWKKARLRRKSVQLDEHGLGKAALPFTKPGVYPVRIVFGGQGVLAQNHVFIGKPDKSPLSVALTRCVIDPEASTLSLALKIAYNRHLHQGKLRLELLSPQRTINAREIEVINGLAETTFPLPNEGPLFLVLQPSSPNVKPFYPCPKQPLNPQWMSASLFQKLSNAATPSQSTSPAVKAAACSSSPTPGVQHRAFRKPWQEAAQHWAK